MNTKNLFQAMMLGAAGMLTLQASAAAPKQAPEYVTVEPAVELTESAPKKYVGRVEAIEEVDLKARVSGNIMAIKFKEGDFVKEGDLLFELEDTTYKAKVQAVQAQHDQIEAELKYNKANYARQKNLFNTKAVAETTYQDAEKSFSVSEAKLAENKALLLETNNDLSYTKIYAPISGRIGKVTYTHGNYVSLSSDKLATIVQTDPISVAFAISEPDFYSIFGNAQDNKENAKIRLQLADGSNYSAEGKVSLVDNKIDSETGTIMIWADFPNKTGKLIPGGLLTVMLSRSSQKATPAVKISGVMTDKQGNYVYVLDKDNKVIRRDVTTGPMVNSYQIISSGIEKGDRVVVDGTHKIFPGATVIPVAPQK